MSDDEYPLTLKSFAIGRAIVIAFQGVSSYDSI